MKKIFYYQPIIRTVAKNGSVLKSGVYAVTQMWDSKKPRQKIDFEQYGETDDKAIEKLRTFFSSGHGEPIQTVTELPCNYYLCSEAVVAHFKPFEVSKPFKSGYESDKDNYYVAWLNYEECEKFYKEVLKEETDFWMRECVPGTMDESKVSIRRAKRDGLFAEIEESIGITAQRNQAMTIFNLSQKYGCTPVQLINKYL